METMSKIRRLGVLALGMLASTLIGCGGGTCGPGNVTAEWTVVASDTAISCTQAGATEVDINVDDAAETFSCNAHAGTTLPVTGGVTHSVSLGLFDSSGNALSETPSMGLFVPCNTNVDIGNVPFSIQ
jgi:hypothetical protein